MVGTPLVALRTVTDHRMPPGSQFGVHVTIHVPPLQHCWHTLPSGRIHITHSTNAIRNALIWYHLLSESELDPLEHAVLPTLSIVLDTDVLLVHPHNTAPVARRHNNHRAQPHTLLVDDLES